MALAAWDDLTRGSALTFVSGYSDLAYYLYGFPILFAIASPSQADSPWASASGSGGDASSFSSGGFLRGSAEALPSNTTVGGRFALRGCVLNYRTALRDMEILLDDLRRVGRSLPASV